MHRKLGWRLTSICLLVGILGCGAPQPIAVGETSPTDSNPAETKSLPPLDLDKVTGYAVTVLATQGKPVGKEKSHVDGIQLWTLNSLGQVIFLAPKQTAGGYVASDLYLATGDTTVPLATQRHEGEHKGRRFSRLRAAWLNDSGQVLLNGFREDNQEDVQLFMLERDQIVPCSINVKHVETAQPDFARLMRGIDSFASDFPELHFGPQQQICFLNWNRQGNEPAAIHAGSVTKVKPVLVADNDPSDPLRQFSSFHAIYGTNSRGQILFDGNVGRDQFDGQRLFLYTPAEKAGLGSVRELARQGARLPETSITLASNNGHEVWHMAALSERGDVVMIAEADRPIESFDDENCLFVLRPGKTWNMLAAANGRLGNVKLPVATVTHATINARGQVAFVARFSAREDYNEQDERLFRLEPDDKLTDLAHVGASLKTGEQISSLSGGQTPGTVPLILAGGQVVVQPTLNTPSTADERTDSILIIDDDVMLEALRIPDQLPEKPEFSNVQIEEIQANDAGYLGLIYSNGSDADSLLLAKPTFATK